MERRRVVITGLGAVTPIGLTAAESWQAVKDGVCGIAPITQFDPTDLKVHLAAEVKGFVPENYMSKPEAKRMGRFTQMAVVSAKEALDGAGFTLDEAEADRCGVIVSSGIGGLSITEAEHDKGKEKGWDRVSPFYIPTGICNMAAGQIAIRFGAEGPCIDVVTACATSSNALGEAFRAIRHGYADAVIAGGCEHMTTPLGIAGFANAKALSRAEDPDYASLPFSADRKGFVMGDGAAVLVLEELEHALARGAEIYGEMVGYGNTCDAYHSTAPRPDGTTQSRSIADALREAGYDAAKDTLYINAHGTGTKLNDSAETLACKLALGDAAYRAHVTSIKSMTGHMFGAAGAAEAIATVMSLNEGVVTPTINLTVPDPECDLDYTPCEAVKAELTLGISNSFGFGGHNACVAFRRYRA